MIGYEFYSLIHHKKKMFVMIMFILLICLDVVMVFKDSFLFEYYKNPIYDLNMVYTYTPTPSTAAFLSGSSRGHILQMMIIWLLPLYFLFIIGDFHLVEIKHNNYQLLKIREKEKTIYLNKLLFSFLVGLIIAFIALTLNFIICLLIFKNGLSQHSSTLGMPWFLSSQNPNLAYCIYILIFSLFTGLYTATLVALSYVVKSKIPLYVIGFGLWYIQIINKYSLTYVFQPFIEYGLSYILPSVFIFLGTCTLVMVLGYYMRKSE